MDLASLGDDQSSQDMMKDIFQSYNIGLMVYNAAVYGKGSFLDSLDTQVSIIK